MTDPSMPKQTVATRAAFRAGVKGMRYTENPDPGFDVPRHDRQRARADRAALRDHRVPPGALQPRGGLLHLTGA